jgi:hypothetical protein
MTTQAPTRIDVQLLLCEARRYLAAVDAFREEGREPTWHAEGDPAPPKRRSRRPAPIV